LGSWWLNLLAWLGDRCGPDKPAPDELGGGALRAIIEAPGTYVFDT
jgi:polyhydroxyalkanoate synthase subunit PhaC